MVLVVVDVSCLGCCGLFEVWGLGFLGSKRLKVGRGART